MQLLIDLLSLHPSMTYRGMRIQAQYDGVPFSDGMGTLYSHVNQHLKKSASRIEQMQLALAELGMSQLRRKAIVTL
jgi:hypothetical protein